CPTRRSCVLLFFFFSSRRRHTRFSRDWSSDVCSSDLKFRTDRIRPFPHKFEVIVGVCIDTKTVHTRFFYPPDMALCDVFLHLFKIGRASCRERVWISVVGVSLKKKVVKDEQR